MIRIAHTHTHTHLDSSPAHILGHDIAMQSNREEGKTTEAAVATKNQSGKHHERKFHGKTLLQLQFQFQLQLQLQLQLHWAAA